MKSRCKATRLSSCLRVASGPRSKLPSSPLPSVSVLTRATSLSVNAWRTFASTSTRLVPVQAWPLSEKPPFTARSTARSRSASASTISGFLPPSSICVRVVRPAPRWICSPAAVDPVKEIARTARAVVMAGPTAAAGPTTRFSTPAGSPACTNASVSR
ncbi:hypothetical protein G6F22_018816 [Rhizopus arrhizus]|nr:hypothetical protein G6F22_018816 [Rhizopus arrhizus]